MTASAATTGFNLSVTPAAALPGQSVDFTGQVAQGVACDAASYDVLLQYVDLAGTWRSSTVAGGTTATAGSAAGQLVVPADARPGAASVVLSAACSSGNAVGSVPLDVLAHQGSLTLAPRFVPLAGVVSVTLAGCYGGAPSGQLRRYSSVEPDGVAVASVDWGAVGADATVTGSVRLPTDPYGFNQYVVQAGCPQTALLKAPVQRSTPDRVGMARGTTYFLRDTLTTGVGTSRGITDFIAPGGGGILLYGRWGAYSSGLSAVYYRTTGGLYQTLTTGVSYLRRQAGPAMYPVACDAWGTGHDDVWIYDSSRARLLPPGRGSFTIGRVGDRPLCGDWNGDGLDDIGLYRPATRTFYLAAVGGSLVHPVTAMRAVVFGRVGDRPVAGDWNGDGRDTVGVIRGAEWLLTNDDRRASADFVFGRPTDQPFVWRAP